MIYLPIHPHTHSAIIRGKANPLVSSFRLSYYTLLNLFRRGEQEGADMEYVIRHSFSQFQHEKELPALERRLAELEAEAEALGRASEGVVEAYRAGTERLEALDATLAAEIRRPERCLHFLRPGRLVRVRQGATDWGWGVVVSVLRVDRGTRREGEVAPGAGDASAYQMDVLLCCAGARDGQPVPARPEDEGAAMEVVPAPLATLRAISTLRISILQDLRPPEARAAVLTTVRALCARYRDGELPLLDPVEDLRVQDPAVAEALAERAALLAELGRNALFQAARGPAEDAAALEPLRRRAARGAAIGRGRAQMRESQLASFKQEARGRSAVLRRLGHLTADNVVTTKGRVACEINTADELLATELMMNGTFNALDKHQLVAMVSCLVQVEKSNEEIRLTGVLATPLRALQDAARRIAETSVECKLEVNVEDYVTSFWPYLMDVIYAWSKGASFAEICEMTDLFEGSIVR